MTNNIHGVPQIPLIISDKSELRRCVMHLWRNYNGLGLNLKNSKNQGHIPHMIRDVDNDSPAQYAGVLNNDLILKIGSRVVEYEKFDTILKLIKDQLKKEKKCEMLLINLVVYYEFKQRHQDTRNNVDYNAPNIQAMIKYYESPLFNPVFTPLDGNTKNASIKSKSVHSMNTLSLHQQSSGALTESPEPRLCHLLTWSNYDGYGFFVAYNSDGCYVKNVEPNSPAQLGGLRAYDRIVEINFKQVNAKDREFIMKQINKHKKQQQNLTSSSKKSFGTNRSKKSTKSSKGETYLNILTCDPTTYKWLTERKIDISTRNKGLKIQECFTPSEYSMLSLMDQGRSSSKIQHEPDLPDMNPIVTTQTSYTNDFNDNILMKLCRISRLKGKENDPLGFEMTKRGTQAHYLSRIEPGSSAALSGLGMNDYLIELNNKNIEQDENSVLREKIFDSLKQNGDFVLLTINKQGYDYCVENKINVSGFCQINNHKIQRFETPRDLSAVNAGILPTVVMESQPEAVATSDSFNKRSPRLCVLKKTTQTSELGLSIARMKNVNEHVINDVVPGSLAEQAGVRVNDCLLEVNGENVENKTHIETVNRIIELARQPNMNISLLVAERSFVLPNNKSPRPETPVQSNIINDLKRAVSNEILNNEPVVEQEQVAEVAQHRSTDIYSSLSKAATLPQTELPANSAYPEIKVCEFLGYPAGTQLGLVVTSDEYSHDVIKVTEDSPAAKAGIAQGDVIIAVNEHSVEGDPTLIAILNEFNETRPLKVLAASRYAYEWSKLLRIRITERDWPNIKKCSTKYIPHYQQQQQHHLGSTKIKQLPEVNQIYSNASYYDPEHTSRPLSKSEIRHSYTEYLTRNNSSHSRPITPREVNCSNKIYYSPSHPESLPAVTKTQRYVANDQLSMASNLSRSAVDITADGQVLRMCTLYLDPSSNNPADSEFGFDLVTKVGRQIGDYFIDTVDEDSPACVSGIKPGDRLVEVDGIDVKNKTFEQVVQIINEAKCRSKLKLLVHPSVIINYGNPSVSKHSCQERMVRNRASQYKSMPDLSLEEPENTGACNHRNCCESVNRNNYKQQSRKSQDNSSGSVYRKKSNLVTNSYSKSTTHIYGTTTSMESVGFDCDTLPAPNASLLRPVIRLCTLYKSDMPQSQYTNHSTNIGFGIQTKPNTSSIIPNYLRVSIVNYKSPAYLAGMEAGDLICEVNGRSTLAMSHDEALYFIKSSYEINGYVRILVMSDFCYNWLREHDLLNTIRYDHASIFSYADFLKHNHRSVPRSCKLRLIGRNKSFGFNLETLLIQPGSSLTSTNKAAATHSYAHIVVKIEKDSPAYAAGLRKGDRIIELDGINVEAENDKQLNDRIFQAFADSRQLTLFVVDPETDQYFKSKCIKLHSLLPIVSHVTNFSDN